MGRLENPPPLEHSDLLWKRTEGSGRRLWWQRDPPQHCQTDTVSEPPLSDEASILLPAVYLWMANLDPISVFHAALQV